MKERMKRYLCLTLALVMAVTGLAYKPEKVDAATLDVFMSMVSDKEHDGVDYYWQGERFKLTVRTTVDSYSDIVQWKFNTEVFDKLSEVKKASDIVEAEFVIKDSSAASKEKITAYAQRFAARHFPQKKCAGSEKRRFLSSICSEGIVTLDETPALLCRKLYLIDDDCGAVSHYLLAELRRLALRAGHDVISCFCPMAPEEKLEHLLIPSAGVGFLCSNHFHPMEHCGASRKIHARRFQDQELRKLKKERFHYNRRAAETLLEQAIALLVESSKLHDRLEELYRDAMDFRALEARFPQIVNQVHNYSC